MQKLSLFIILSIVSQLLFANTASMNALSQLMGNIHTMQAVFEQSLVNANGAHIGAKITGKMLLERPGKFRWEIIKPNKQLIIVNKNKMLSYDEDLSQLTKRKVNIDQPGNPAMLLSSSIEMLQQSFQIVKLKQTNQEQWFKLIPKKQYGYHGYQWIKIGFIRDKLSAMYIFDDLDQTSFINFSNTVLNAKIKDKLFIFVPPPHTEIFSAE